MKSWVTRHWPVLVLVSLNLLIGWLVVKDYGLSVDELGLFGYGHQSLNAYRAWIEPQYVPFFGKDSYLQYYGPAYTMLIALASSLIQGFWPRTFEPDLWHYASFVCFQSTGLGLYWLATRWFSWKTAFLLTALFLFQPLFWGHAFINPKDIPFLMAFTLSLALGVWAADKLPAGKAQTLISIPLLKENWVQADFRKRRIAVLGSLFWLLLLAGLWFGWDLIMAQITALVRTMYLGQNLFLAWVFHRFVSTASLQPVENYISKASAIASLLRNVSCLVLTLVAIFLYRPVLPGLFTGLEFASLQRFFRQSFHFFRSPALWLAALFLGLTTSIRVLGPWAGILIAVYFFWRLRENALPALLVYGLVAVFCAYLTWPSLWSDPVDGFLSSLKVMSAFPWQGKVLFDGVQYAADRLPWTYLPVLLALQLTEPVLVVFILGLAQMAFGFYRKNIPVDFAGLFLGWFLLPMVFLILSHPPMYDNFRQIFFLLPPLFLVGGLALETIFQRFRQTWVMLLVAGLLLIPSVFPLIRLHPYQYIYYNSLAGNVSGAEGRFEMDYWYTSYAEAMRAVNQIAPPGAKILTWTFATLTREYARPDLVVAPQTTRDVGNFDYAILTSRGGKDLSVFPEAPVIFEVQREGAIFSVVKKISPPALP